MNYKSATCHYVDFNNFRRWLRSCIRLMVTVQQNDSYFALNIRYIPTHVGNRIDWFLGFMVSGEDSVIR
jgi:hypothetical protein